MKPLYQLLILILPAFSCASFANPRNLPPTSIGVNGHPLTDAQSYPSSMWQTMFEKMRENGITRLRVDVPLTPETDATMVSRFSNLLVLASYSGIQLEPVIQVPFSWGDRTNGGKFPKGDATALYDQGYGRVYSFVSWFADDVQDWELSNELNGLVHDASGSPLYGKGMTAAEFNVPLMQDWAWVLAGMSQAIEDINSKRGLHLRRILGTTSSMFGFIDFMRSRGVKIDVLGYHYYENRGVNPYKYWLASGGTFDLLNKLGSYKLPIHLNEINCAEIYSPSFQNSQNSPSMQTCNANFNQMLALFTDQTEANIESIQAYELVDQAQLDAPENRFGMLTNLSAAKPLFSTLASWASTQQKSSAPNINFSSLYQITNHTAVTIHPREVNVSNLGCSATGLPANMSVDVYTCTVWGWPNVPNVPAGGVVQTVNFRFNIAPYTQTVKYKIYPN
jgi:hypothetical protein